MGNVFTLMENTTYSPEIQPAMSIDGAWRFNGYYPERCQPISPCETDVIWFEREETQNADGSYHVYKKFTKKVGYC